MRDHAAYCRRFNAATVSQISREQVFEALEEATAAGARDSSAEAERWRLNLQRQAGQLPPETADDSK